MTPAGAPHPGDPSELRALDAEQLGTLRAGLHLMALYRLGDADLAEEATQEALARALAALREGTAGDIRNLGAFLHGIARHVIADLLRARARTGGTEALVNMPDPRAGEDALSRSVSAEEHRHVRDALERLRKGDRRILHLCYYEGLTPAEIAERLGEPADRVRKRKSRALARLRQAFLGEPAGHDIAPAPTGSMGVQGAPTDAAGESA